MWAADSAARSGLNTEFSAIAAAALRLNRPLTWIETRSEDLVALPHSRAQVQYVELGCKRDGTFTGLRARIVGDSGAYPGVGTLLPGGTRRMSMGTYNLPKLSVDIACATTNTTPTGAYRGAGRPEAASMVERIVDLAAARTGHGPCRDPPQELHPARPVPVHDHHRGQLRLRATTTNR